MPPVWGLLLVLQCGCLSYICHYERVQGGCLGRAGAGPAAASE